MKIYPHVSYYDFGVDLLETYDLDPIYPMLVMSGIPENILKRWMLAYWCYYSAGVASYIAESDNFYEAMLEQYKTYPRGHERRHFRGDAGLKSINALKAFGSPEKVVDYMMSIPSYTEISKRAQSFPGFGPWISWKINDMAERVMQFPVDFSGADLYMYRDPVQGAALLRFGDKHHPITRDELAEEIDNSLATFACYMAPPYLDRPLNVQEVETLFCKYKAHVNGAYSLGTDSFDIAHGLHEWGDLAQHMYMTLSKVTTYLAGSS